MTLAELGSAADVSGSREDTASWTGAFALNWASSECSCLKLLSAEASSVSTWVEANLRQGCEVLWTRARRPRRLSIGLCMRTGRERCTGAGYMSYYHAVLDGLLTISVAAAKKSERDLGGGGTRKRPPSFSGSPSNIEHSCCAGGTNS